MTLRMLDLGAVVGRKSCADDVVVGAAYFLRACVAQPLREHRGGLHVGERMVARRPGTVTPCLNGRLASPSSFSHAGAGGVYFWPDPERDLLSL